MVVIALAFAVMLPFIWMIVTSLKGPTEVFAYPPILDTQRSTRSNYIEMWKEAPFGRYFLNSAIVAIAVTIGQTTSCFLAAFAFAVWTSKGKNVMFMIFLSTTMISSQVTLYPYLPGNADPGLGLIRISIDCTFPGNAFGVFMLRHPSVRTS